MILNKPLSKRSIGKLLGRVFHEHHDEVRKILKKVKVKPDKGCWLLREDWTTYTLINKEPGHRFMFQMFYKEPIEGFYICHKCDRPGCINPDHLFKGSAGDNYRDAMNKGRVTRNKINCRMNEFTLNKLKRLDTFKQLRYTLEDFAHASRHRK